MVARSGIADKGTVDCGRSGENFTGWQVGPVTRAYKAAGFDPVEAAIEMRREGSASFGLNRERFGVEHAFAELVAKAIYHAVIRAHSLLHDFSGDTDHVGVADLAALDDTNDGHARAEFADLRRHAHGAYVGGFESSEDGRRGGGHGPRTKLFEN